MEITNQNTKTKKTADRNRPSADTDLLNDESGLVDNIEREARRLQSELEIERDARLRLAAEYQNYRRRTEQEKAESADRGKQELLTELLSIVDDLALARDPASGSPETVTEGVKLIHRRFLDLLDVNGVTAFDSEGERFDPERHEAFDVTAEGEAESGTVVKEMRRGYFWKSRLMRPALVLVKK